MSNSTSEWKPIETAPTDGTEVIVFDKNNDPDVFTAAYAVGWSYSVADRYSPEDTFFGDPDKNPSHWMPLPKAPTNLRKK